jgi:hypothetical protein
MIIIIVFSLNCSELLRLPGLWLWWPVARVSSPHQVNAGHDFDAAAADCQEIDAQPPLLR